MPEKNVIELDLTPELAKKLVSEISKNSLRVTFTKHAEKRMKQRKITRIQVFRCLNRGAITEGPARDIKGNWKVTFNTISAGDDISVVVVLDHDNSGNYVIVITVF